MISSQYYQNVLAKHGVSRGEWAVMITAGYYVPLPRPAFVFHAVGEFNVPITESDVADGLDSCLRKGLVKLTGEGHVEKYLNIFGEPTGDDTEYPQDGVILTDEGHKLHRAVAFSIFGEDYFQNDRMPQGA